MKPTNEQLLAARNKSVPDVITDNLAILFCGINPSIYTAAVGHHFARPGNRFWPALYLSGLTSSLLNPFEEHRLISAGLGITNIVQRATATAAELTPVELEQGSRALIAKVNRFHPKILAILGIGAYKAAFSLSAVAIGRQPDTIGSTVLWVLPNPSGINAGYQIDALANLFRDLKNDAGL